MMEMIIVKATNKENIEKKIEYQYSNRDDGEKKHIGSTLEKQRKEYFKNLFYNKEHNKAMPKIRLDDFDEDLTASDLHYQEDFDRKRKKSHKGAKLIVYSDEKISADGDEDHKSDDKLNDKRRQ